MIHSFNTEIASKYGVNAAVIFNHISYWLEKNAANNTNYYDGEYWTYSSIKGFKQIFHYMSENQIRTALKKLTDNDVLKTGNYNKLAYDRTLWYAFGKIGKSIWEKSQMEIEKITNGNYENHKPIPDNITDNITDNNKQINNNTSRFIPPTSNDVYKYCIEKGYIYVNPDAFVEFYGSKGWMVGKNKMTNWRMSVSGWNRRAMERGERPYIRQKTAQAKFQQPQQEEEDAWSELFGDD